MPQRYVISGCSGSGKSTLLDALAVRGETVVQEPGRRVVRQQMGAGEDGLPWGDAQRFVDLCAATAIADFDAVVAPCNRAFFDRSFVDVAAAVARTGLRMPAGLPDALRTKRYCTTVFMSPPWRELFRQDAERRHGFDEAVAEYDALVPAYRGLGYRLEFLPSTSVVERLAFVLAVVAPIHRQR